MLFADAQLPAGGSDIRPERIEADPSARRKYQANSDPTHVTMVSWAAASGGE